MLESVSKLAAKHRWLPFVLPFVVYMVLGQFEPTPDQTPPLTLNESVAEVDQAPRAASSTFSSLSYPLYYAIRIAITACVALLFLPTYRSFPMHVHPLSLFIGAVGVVLWVGLCRLDWEADLLRWIGQSAAGARPSFDPFAKFGSSPELLVAFLAIRFAGLACLVPLLEEFFLRGFVMRYFLDTDWWKIPIGTATPAAVAIGTAYGVLSHPAEAIAAAVWFSLITWWVAKRRNIWDGVAAHATTNLLLGVYVLVSQDWSLW